MKESPDDYDDIDGAFTINSLENLSNQYVREGYIENIPPHKNIRAVDQVPMRLNIPGVPSLRLDSGSLSQTAYHVTVD